MSAHLPRAAALLTVGKVLTCALVLGLLTTVGAPSWAAEPATVSYNRDVRPILAEHCFACHGPDAGKRKAGLGLHLSALATAALPSGAVAVVPGDAAASAVITRILTEDDDDRMPPEETGKRLTPAQIETLRTWVAEGAEWQPHWAYVAPTGVAATAVDGDTWSRGTVDRFILARLRREGLTPSPPAEPVTLVRRLGFDLVGLPPTPEEVDAFVADPSDAAYERLVDRLLASPHFGERMAMSWLDLVRYADSTGYHSDNARNVAPYRDWVIRAFNDDMPFDRFTIEQLAGDLLPSPSIDQRVASGYNRLTMTTEEGGAQAKEYEAKSAADRVRNVSAVWMGATMGCCECHDHKFDPYTARDFYRMSAFFADIKEAAIGAREPGMPVPDPAQAAALASCEAEMLPLRAQLASATPALDAAQLAWELGLATYAPPILGTWHAIGPFRAESPSKAFTTRFGPEDGVDLEAAIAGQRWAPKPEWKDGAIHHLVGDNSATYLHRAIEWPSGGMLRLALGSDDTITVWIDGQVLLSKEVYRGVAPNQDQLQVALTPGRHALLMKITNGGGGYGFVFDTGGTGVPDAILATVKLPAAQRSDAQRGELAAYYRSIAPLLSTARASLATLEARKAALEAATTRCLVTESAPPRVTRIKARGDWMDESGEVVEPGIPGFLGDLATKERASRLDLARWLAARSNPLTSRVFVNRLWRMLFGVGISKSLDDLGSQGEWPVHPELLDWLADDFSGNGWRVKRAVKQLVMSSAYRQSSRAGALAERDPDNRLVARQSRFRLDAELVRDDALAISGLLVPTVGGRSVRPYQPAGYWMHLNFPRRDWNGDVGTDAYRRGLYTWWQRTFLHPSLLAFDASTREECTAARPRSSTPQQALTLLNDPTYVEAARAFAERIIVHGGATTQTRLTWAWRRALSRAPTTDEIRVTTALVESQLSAYRADVPAALALLAVGQHPIPPTVDTVELAAWTSLARAVLNLHETITRY